MSYADATTKQIDYWLDIREHFNAYEEPSFELFGAAARAIFKDDPKLIVKPMTGPLQGVYRVVSTSTPSENFITLNRIDRTSGATEGVVIPLSTSSPARKSQRGDLLVTIVDADMGSAAGISGRDFDTAFAEFGRVIVPTKPQRYQNTSILNGNRYIVMDINAKVPNRLDINGHSFLLKYKGKKWYCSSCNEEHVGACKYLQTFYALKDKKAQAHLTTTIIGDSSLRLVENVGLLADVACMSGASAGQLVTAVENHPNQAKHVEVVIAAGANDVKSLNSYDNAELCKRIDKSLDRVSDIITKDLNRNFYFLNTTPEEQEVSPQDFIARSYFKKRLEKLALTSDNFEVLKPKTNYRSWENGHPTQQATEIMIRAIAHEYPSVIQDENFISTSKPYRGVDSLWLSGCSGCRTRGRFTSGGFCTSCTEAIDVCSVAEPAIYLELMKELEASYPGDRKRAREPTNSSSDDDVKKIVLQ